MCLVTVAVWVYFWVRYSVPLFRVSVFYQDFAVYPTIISWVLQFLTQHCSFVQDCIIYPGSFVLVYEFQDCLLQYYKECLEC